MYLASFPLVGHAGPLLPWCARQFSRSSDQRRSRPGEREMVLGRSLGKINTLQDLCHRSLLWEPTARQSEPWGWQAPRTQQGSSCWDWHCGLLQVLPPLTLNPSLTQPH